MPPLPTCIDNIPVAASQGLSQAALGALGLDAIKAKAKALKALITQLYTRWQLQVRYS